MIDSWLKEVKIVIFREAFKQASVPQSSSFGEKAVWLELPAYKLNTEEMKVIVKWCPHCNGLNICSKEWRSSEHFSWGQAIE